MKPSEIAEWAYNGVSPDNDLYSFPSQSRCSDLARAYLRLREAAEQVLLGTDEEWAHALLHKALEETNEAE